MKFHYCRHLPEKSTVASPWKNNFHTNDQTKQTKDLSAEWTSCKGLANRELTTKINELPYNKHGLCCIYRRGKCILNRFVMDPQANWGIASGNIRPHQKFNNLALQLNKWGNVENLIVRIGNSTLSKIIVLSKLCD